jgi:hypothetical protein
MNIIVDACTAVKWAFNEEYSEEASRIKSGIFEEKRNSPQKCLIRLPLSLSNIFSEFIYRPVHGSYSVSAPLSLLHL